MKFVVPQEILDREAGPRDDVFPEGLWEGVVEVVRVRTITEGEGGDFFLRDKTGNYFASECEVASLQIGENVAVEEGQPDIGGLKYFDDNIILSFDGLNWTDYEYEENDPRWQLRLAQTRLTKLAHALDLTENVEGGVVPVDTFDDFFRSTDEGEGLNGMAVRYKVIHRIFPKREEKALPRKDWTGKEAQTAQYYPAG